MHVRDALPTDETFLREMLYEAAYWRPGSDRPPREEALASAKLRAYIESWGREGDAGVVAVEAGRPCGAAWFRVFSPSAAGYGFVDEGVPELTIAVVRERRGEGIGTMLLDRLLERARLSGLGAISLSVEPGNRARSFYERAGFERIGTNDGAWTMVRRLGGG